MKGKFILDVKVRFKGGVLSPLFYQNSTRLRPRQPRGAAAGSPGRNIWRMGMGRKGAGDGSCVPLEKGRRGNSAVTNGRWALPWLNWSGDRSHFFGSYL